MKEVYKFTINSDNNILAKTSTDFKVSLKRTLLYKMYILASVKSTETYHSSTFLTIF